MNTPVTIPTPDILRRRGFTLIELLTVIAIIGILAAILIPTVGTVRKTAKRTQGLSNIRQVTMTSLNLINENRGRFIYTHEYFVRGGPKMTWSRVLANYAAKASLYQPMTATPDWFRDPVARGTANPAAPADHHFAPFQFFTSDTADSNALRSFRQSLFNVKSPGKQVFFADIYVDDAGNTHGDIWDGPNVGWFGNWVANNPTALSLVRTPPAAYGKTPGQIDFSRDIDQAKFSFLDGHVKLIKKRDFREHYMNPFAY